MSRTGCRVLQSDQAQRRDVHAAIVVGINRNAMFDIDELGQHRCLCSSIVCLVERPQWAHSQTSLVRAIYFSVALTRADAAWTES